MIATLMEIKNIQEESLKAVSEGAQHLIYNHQDWTEEEFAINLLDFCSVLTAVQSTMLSNLFLGEEKLEEMSNLIAEFGNLAEDIENE